MLVQARPPLKASDHWCTPKWLLELVEAVAPIALDPCPGPVGWTNARSELRLEQGDDGLETSWYGHWTEDLASQGLIYVNPPYGRGHLDLWAPKIAAEAERGAADGMEIIALLPATPGPEWWQKHVVPAAQALCFLAGRPRFVHPDEGRKPREKDTQTGTKDAVVVYYGDRSRAFGRAFVGRGWTVNP